MKALKRVFYGMILCSAVLMMASCLSSSNDDNNTTFTLTPEQRSMQIKAIAGDYMGEFYFINDTTMAMDSLLNIHASITAADSTLAIQIPLKVLSHGMPAPYAKQLIRSSDAIITLKSDIKLYPNSNNTQGFYTFWSVPTTDKAMLTYTIKDQEGKEHQIRLQGATEIRPAYSSYIYSSLGEYYERNMDVYQLFSDIYFDESRYATNMVTMFKGKK